MSDLETAASRTPAAPISALANGKLQAMSAASVRFGDTDQLVDAFAEVFARMAVATPSPVQSEPADANVNREDDSDNDASLESNGQESSDNDTGQESVSNTNQTVQLTEDQPAIADPRVSKDNADQEAETLPEEAVVNESVKALLETKEETEGEVADEQEQVDFAIIDSDEPAIKTESVETIKKVATAVAAAAGAESDTSRKRDSQSAKNITTPEEQGPFVQAKSTTDAVDTTQSEDANEASDLSSGKSTRSQSDGLPKRTKRQQRLNENRDNHGAKAGSQSSEQRAETQHSTAVTADSNGIEPTNVTKPAAQQTPVARNPDSAVHAIQNAPVRSSAPTTNSTTSESRGTSNSIQPVETNRADGGRRRETSGAKQNTTDTTARIKLVQRVSRAFQHLGPDGGMVRLRLAPAELGSVRVEMRVDKQSVQARVVTETEAASATLREHLPDLRARLESFGMQVEQIEVDTEANSDQTGLPFDREPQQRQDQRQPRNRDRVDQGQQDQPANESNGVAAIGPTLQPALASRGIDLKL